MGRAKDRRHSLKFADDVVMISDPQKGLSGMFRELGKHSDRIELIVK